MNRTVIGILLICIAVSTGLISIAASTALAQPESGPATEIAPAGSSAEILSITYWVNGVKYNLPFGTTDIYVTQLQNVAFQVKGKYIGPAGTTGELYINEETDYWVIDDYKLIHAGTVSKVTTSHAWSRNTPGTRTFEFVCLVPGTTVGLGRFVNVHYT